MSESDSEILRRIAKDVAEIKSALSSGAVAIAAGLGAKVGVGSGGATGSVATDAELDSRYGDPDIKRDPSRWTGPSFVGSRYSESSPEYLDCVADFKDWQASKDEASGAKDSKGRPKANWARKDARLARGWAARLRSGWKPTYAGGSAGSTTAANEDYDDGGFGEEIPF